MWLSTFFFLADALCPPDDSLPGPVSTDAISAPRYHPTLIKNIKSGMILFSFYLKPRLASSTTAINKHIALCNRTRQASSGPAGGKLGLMTILPVKGVDLLNDSFSWCFQIRYDRTKKQQQTESSRQVYVFEPRWTFRRVNASHFTSHCQYPVKLWVWCTDLSVFI